MTISCLDDYPRKFIHEKRQDDQTSKFCTSKISQYTVNALVMYVCSGKHVSLGICVKET